MAQERCTNHTSYLLRQTHGMHISFSIYFSMYLCFPGEPDPLTKERQVRGQASQGSGRDPWTPRLLGYKACRRADKRALPAVARCALVVPLVACEAPPVHQCRPVKEARSETVTYMVCLMTTKATFLVRIRGTRGPS